MPAQSDAFRDFGILPEEMQSPTGKVRAFLSPGRIAGQYLGTAIVVGIGLLAMGLSAWFLPAPLNYLGALAQIAGWGVFAYLATRNDFDWVELDGEMLRAHHLYTGRILERKVQEIERLVTVVHHGGTAEGAVIQHLLGRIKGMEIKFRDKRTPLKVLRSDPAMTNAMELLQAILFRMSEIDELDADIGEQGGRPFVRNVHWKHEEPVQHPNDLPFNLAACIVILLGLVMGPIFGCVADEQRDLLEVSQQPLHELTLAELIEKGPGASRHVTVTNFEPGGYYFESKDGTWTQVWVALFPQGEPQNEIKVVYSPKSVGNEATFRQLMAQPKITGACSETPRTSWRTQLGPDLSKANRGATLAAAWNIDDISNPPTTATVQFLYFAVYGSFAAVLLLALSIFGKALMTNLAG
jgi:hypothetical protein